MNVHGHEKNILKGTLILTFAALLIKVLSAFYRIPFQNIVGDIGFYIYQQVYPFYGIAVALSTYGFPVVISKLYTEEIAKDRGKQCKAIASNIRSFLNNLLVLPVLHSLYGGAGWLANYMNDPKLTELFKMVSVVFLIMPVLSLLRGYFQGTGDMIPTAVSQVGEQFIRVATILISASILVHNHFSLYKVGSGAILGSVTGGIISALILGLFWVKIRRVEPLQGSICFRQSGKIIKAFILQGFPICVSSMLLILIQLADSLNLYSLLVDSGIGTGNS